MSRQPNVFNIPAGTGFADALVSGIDRRWGGSADALCDVRILVPTRRAVRTLKDAFLRHSGGRPLLMPRIATLGDLDEDEIAFDEGAMAGEEGLDLPPAIDGLRRRLLLARLVMAEGRAAPGAASMATDQAARLALDLARFLDETETERLSFDRLDALVPEDYAVHWQSVLTFLRILTRHWPAILEDESALDPAVRRDLLMTAQARRWQDSPPATPIVAAGSTGSVPATADLLRVVAGLPNGAVVLPGLDSGMPDDAWTVLPPSHPQFGMARLLERIGVARASVRLWDESRQPESRTASGRFQLLARAFHPADALPVAAASPGAREALELSMRDVRRVDCATQDEEAGVIALLLREALEVPGRTAALVTPDRVLARRVAAELGRWGIDIDDSAGVPLAATPPGTFLALTAAMAAESLAPVDLLAALKHPLAAGGENQRAFRARIRDLELAALRGPRPAPGFHGLRKALGGERHAELRAWMAGLERLTGSFVALARQPRVSLDVIVEEHLGCAEALAATDIESGVQRLWARESGEAAARFASDLRVAAVGFPPIAGADYAALLRALMSGHVVRPRYGRHPRLFIWGPLESRLQRVDRIILGGLNEGTWPAETPADPWMSRSMRKDFGLPPADRHVGQSAHDFVQAFGAEDVFLTRAARVEGTPMVESRWLLRLDAALAEHSMALGMLGESPWREWWRRLDTAPYVPDARPAPCPPVDARPDRLSVTRIETLIRDPYAIYARHVLSLRPLDPIDAEPDAADRGTIIHEALDAFLTANAGPLPTDALDRLLDIGRAVFGRHLDRPGVRAFWWPRFEAIARWFVAVEGERRQKVLESLTECRGAIALPIAGRTFTLTAKADRIDRLADGSLSIIDYKTGVLPSNRSVERGLAPQLPLEAAIAGRGGFEAIPPAKVRELAYWRLTGARPAGEEKVLPGSPEDTARAALDGLVRLIETYSDVATPYAPVPRPSLAPRFNDYAHLARIQEWSTSADGSGE